MKPIYVLIIAALFACVLWPGCSTTSEKPDVSGVKVDLKLRRFEKELFSAKNEADLLQIRSKDTFFYDIFTNHLIGDITGGMRVSGIEKTSNLLKFITHEDMLDLYENCEKKYADFDKYFSRLEAAITYYKYYLPERKIPEVVTMVSPFRAAHPCTQNNLGIGLDMYLGADFGPYYARDLEFPAYQIKKMRPDYLVPNAMKAWLLSEFEEPKENVKFLDLMVYQGKVLYMLDHLLPDTHDSLIIGYFAGQLEFCENQEFQIWDNILSNKLLYSTDLYAYRGYLGDGPFTSGPGVPADAPPKIGEWLGWQIVKAYMKKQPATDFETLMKLPAQKVLDVSKYKP